MWCVSNLVIETTRRCNLACKHCLRGDAQPIDITDDILAMAFKDITHVGHLTVTGGEPLYSPKTLKLLMRYLEERSNLTIGSLYMSTNAAVRMTQDLWGTLCRLFALVDEDEAYMTALSISNHPCTLEDIETRDLLKQFKETSYKLKNVFKFASDRYTSDDKFCPEWIVREGKGESWGKGRHQVSTTEYMEINLEEEHAQFDSTIYLNALGQWVLDCDWSYASQEILKVGTCEDPFTKVMRKLVDAQKKHLVADASGWTKKQKERPAKFVLIPKVRESELK